MLRYDGCHPEGSADTSAITHDGKRRVRLIGYSPIDRGNDVTPDRWKSYLWTVVPDSIKPLE